VEEVDTEDEDTFVDEEVVEETIDPYFC